MRPRIWMCLAALGLALAGCSSDGSQPAPPPSNSAPAAPAPLAPPPMSPAPAPRPSNDMCGAAEAQKLVGRSRREIPIPLLPALQRVACTTCPVTMDFNPRRLNFFYDAETGLIKEVKCG